MTNLPRSDDLGKIVRPTTAERATIRANIRRLAQDSDDAAYLCAVFGVDV